MRSGLWLLSVRHLQHNKLQTGILGLCIALSVFLPVTTHILTSRYDDDLTARARSSPLVLGTPGNETDLTLCALYFRQSKLEPVPFGQVKTLRDTGFGVAVPVNVRHTAQRHPIVGVSAEYYEERGLTPARGTLPLMLGDCLLGAHVAKTLGIDAGGHLFSDPTDVYDIARPPTLKMHVSGVLPQTRTPDDDAVFVDIGTCWILEGAAHGHQDAEKLTGNKVLGRREGTVALSPAVKEYQEVSEKNLGSFHVHGDEAKLPLSAVLVFPKDDKSATLLKARTNLKSEFRIVVPTQVIEELMAVVFKVKTLLDTFAAFLATSTGAMLLLQVLLSMRLRAREMLTLERIGCSPGTVGQLYACEIVLVVLGGVALAGIGVATVTWLLPDLVRTF
jgi:putative ABC transport system permease protein